MGYRFLKNQILRTVVRGAFAGILIAACSIGSPPAIAEGGRTPPDLAALIRQLGADEFALREAAVAKLLEVGERALDALGKASDDADIEVAFRSQALVKLIGQKLTAEVRQFSGHTDQILCVAFDKTGKRCASGGFDKVIRVWDVESGRELNRLVGHKDIVFSVAFSPDGSQLVSASGGDRQGDQWSEGTDHTIRLWDLKSGKETGRIEGQMDWALCAIFSPDGKQIVTSTRNRDPLIRLWDAATLKEVRTFAGHQLGVRSLAFSADGKSLVSSGYDLTIRLWDVESGKERKQFAGHSGWIDRVVFSPNGRQLLSSSRDNTLRLWDIETGRAVRTITGHGDHVLSADFSADGNRGVSSSGDGTVRIWNLKTGVEEHRYTGHANVIDTVCVSPDGKFALSGGKDGTVRLWRMPR